jgi:outer membrane autotransporter protein
MNKGFRIVWSQVRHAYVVTSEITKTYGKKSAGTSSFKKKVGLIALVLFMPTVWGEEGNNVDFSNKPLHFFQPFKASNKTFFRKNTDTVLNTSEAGASTAIPDQKEMYHAWKKARHHVGDRPGERVPSPRPEGVKRHEKILSTVHENFLVKDKVNHALPDNNKALAIAVQSQLAPPSVERATPAPSLIFPTPIPVARSTNQMAEDTCPVPPVDTDRLPWVGNVNYSLSHNNKTLAIAAQSQPAPPSVENATSVPLLTLPTPVPVSHSSNQTAEETCPVPPVNTELLPRQLAGQVTTFASKNAFNGSIAVSGKASSVPAQTPTLTIEEMVKNAGLALKKGKNDQDMQISSLPHLAKGLDNATVKVRAPQVPLNSSALLDAPQISQPISISLPQSTNGTALLSLENKGVLPPIQKAPEDRASAAVLNHKEMYHAWEEARHIAEKSISDESKLTQPVMVSSIETGRLKETRLIPVYFTPANLAIPPAEEASISLSTPPILPVTASPSPESIKHQEKILSTVHPKFLVKDNVDHALPDSNKALAIAVQSQPARPSIESAAPVLVGSSSNQMTKDRTSVAIPDQKEMYQAWKEARHIARKDKPSERVQPVKTLPIDTGRLKETRLMPLYPTPANLAVAPAEKASIPLSTPSIPPATASLSPESVKSHEEILSTVHENFLVKDKVDHALPDNNKALAIAAQSQPVSPSVESAAPVPVGHSSNQTAEDTCPVPLVNAELLRREVAGQVTTLAVKNALNGSTSGAEKISSVPAQTPTLTIEEMVKNAGLALKKGQNDQAVQILPLTTDLANSIDNATVKMPAPQVPLNGSTLHGVKVPQTSQVASTSLPEATSGKALVSLENKGVLPPIQKAPKDRMSADVPDQKEMYQVWKEARRNAGKDKPGERVQPVMISPIDTGRLKETRLIPVYFTPANLAIPPAEEANVPLSTPPILPVTASPSPESIKHHEKILSTGHPSFLVKDNVDHALPDNNKALASAAQSQLALPSVESATPVAPLTIVNPVPVPYSPKQTAENTRPVSPVNTERLPWVGNVDHALPDNNKALASAAQSQLALPSVESATPIPSLAPTPAPAPVPVPVPEAYSPNQTAEDTCPVALPWALVNPESKEGSLIVQKSPEDRASAAIPDHKERYQVGEEAPRSKETDRPSERIQNEQGPAILPTLTVSPKVKVEPTALQTPVTITVDNLSTTINATEAEISSFPTRIIRKFLKVVFDSGSSVNVVADGTGDKARSLGATPQTAPVPDELETLTFGKPEASRTAVAAENVEPAVSPTVQTPDSTSTLPERTAVAIGSDPLKSIESEERVPCPLDSACPARFGELPTVTFGPDVSDAVVKTEQPGEVKAKVNKPSLTALKEALANNRDAPVDLQGQIITFNFNDRLTSEMQGQGRLAFLDGIRTISGASPQLQAKVFFAAGTNTTLHHIAALGNSKITLEKEAVLQIEKAQGEFFSTLAGEGDVRIGQTSRVVFAKSNDSSAFAGKTSVAGVLVVNGTLGGMVEIQPKARLQGSGKMDTVVVQAGGTFAPGNSIGAPIIGKYMELDDDSILEIEIAPDGRSDHITVEGKAKLAHTHLVVIGDGTSHYKVGTRYTILTAGEEISGEFADMTKKALPFIDLALNRDSHHIYLDVTRNSQAFAKVAANSNQAAVATALSTSAAGSAGWGLYELISNLPTTAAARQVFDLVSGEIYASSQSFLLNDSHHVRDTAINRLRTEKANQDQPTAWGQGYGSWGSYAATSKVAKLGYHQSGVLLGSEGAADNWRIGIVGGYGQSRLKVNERDSHAKVESYHMGVYTGTQLNHWNIRLGTAYQWNRVNTTRHFEIHGQGFNHHTNSCAQTLQFFGEVGYPFITDSAVIEPTLNVAHVRVRNHAFRESGSGLTALHGDSHQNNVTFSTLGIRATKIFAMKNTDVTLQGGLGWRHAYGEVNPRVRLSLAEGDTFTIGGVSLAKDMAVINAGVNIKVGKHTSVELNYAGTVAKKAQENSMQANFVWKF